MFGLRCTVEPQCLVFPAFDPEGSKVVGLKVLKREMVEGESEKAKIVERTMPR